MLFYLLHLCGQATLRLGRFSGTGFGALYLCALILFAMVLFRQTLPDLVEAFLRPDAPATSA